MILTTVVTFIWGFTLLQEPANTSSLAGLLTIFGNHYVAGGVCLAAACCAAVFLWPSEIRWSIPATLAFLLPQQFVLMVASLTSFRCVMQGHFADGIERSPMFILSDQAWVILLAYFHWIALITWVHDNLSVNAIGA